MKKLNKRHFSFKLKKFTGPGVHVNLEEAIRPLSDVEQRLSQIFEDLKGVILTPAIKEEVVQRIENVLCPLAYKFYWTIDTDSSDIKITLHERSPLYEFGNPDPL